MSVPVTVGELMEALRACPAEAPCTGRSDDPALNAATMDIRPRGLLSMSRRLRRFEDMMDHEYYETEVYEVDSASGTPHLFFETCHLLPGRPAITAGDLLAALHQYPADTPCVANSANPELRRATLGLSPPSLLSMSRQGQRFNNWANNTFHEEDAYVDDPEAGVPHLLFLTRA